MTRRRQQSEERLYPHVRRWAEDWVRQRLGAIDVVALDTHRWKLNEVIRRHGLEHFFTSEEWRAFEVKVDVTVFFRSRERHGMVFVECKVRPIALADLSQLLGYSRVARPSYAFLISPAGVGPTVKELLTVYGRTDILEYLHRDGTVPRRILLATWDESRRALAPGSLIPSTPFL